MWKPIWIQQIQELSGLEKLRNKHQKAAKKVAELKAMLQEQDQQLHEKDKEIQKLDIKIMKQSRMIEEYENIIGSYANLVKTMKITEVYVKDTENAPMKCIKVEEEY